MKKKTWGLLAGAGAAVAAVVYFVTRGGGPEPPPPGKANLYGKVKDSSTGKGLGGVVVALNSQQTLTDSQGNYTLANLDPGDYTLGFAKDGYITISGDITLEEGNNEINVELTPTGAPSEESTFTVIPTNIPDYAAGAYQYYISYGGKTWGMVNPQEDILTPIDEPLTIIGPRTGTVHVYLEAGPWNAWNFYIVGTFEDGEEYPLDLTEGIPGAGVALTNLVVEPDYFNLGEAATISVTAINKEDTSMKKEIIFAIAGSEVGRETIDLGPGESKEVAIEVTPSAAGKYTVGADGLTASFEVKEPYPNITVPTIKSMEWLPAEHLSFKGTILLPQLGKGQGYLVKGLIRPEGDDRLSDGTVSYIANGLWNISGVVGMTGSRYCTKTVPEWHVKCPLCGFQHQTKNLDLHPEGIIMWAREVLRSHAEIRCYEGGADHCGFSGSGTTWITQEQITFWSPGPCPGTIMALYIYVAILGPTGGDPPYQIEKEWTILTAHPRLEIIIDVNGNLVLFPTP